MASPERKLGRHHLALYRGWLQGVPLKTLADRYLETGLDLRLAKTTLTWIGDTIREPPPIFLDTNLGLNRV